MLGKSHVSARTLSTFFLQDMTLVVADNVAESALNVTGITLRLEPMAMLAQPGHGFEAVVVVEFWGYPYARGLPWLRSFTLIECVCYAKRQL